MSRTSSNAQDDVELASPTVVTIHVAPNEEIKENTVTDTNTTNAQRTTSPSSMTNNHTSQTSPSSHVPTDSSIRSPSTVQHNGVHDSKSSQISAAAANLAYVEYLVELQKAWKDCPDITISYSNISYTIPVPSKLREVPTLATAAYDSTMHTIESMSGKQIAFPALRPMSGVIKPGKMTLVLAPPSAGKSFFLKALAGRLHKSPNFSGQLQYNGIDAHESQSKGIHLNKLCSFVDQVDIHIPQLTVRETFDIAIQHSAVNVNLLSSSSARLTELASKRTDMMIDLLGLRECENTIIGDDMLRGVSGGQRKRVTIGEALLSNSRVLLLDEPSTGLDSSAVFHIFNYLRDWTRITNGSVVTALLQPTPEVVALFDDVILMVEGDIVYHGPTTSVLSYFESLNLPTSRDQDTADYLTDFLSYPRAVYYRNLYRKLRAEKTVINESLNSYLLEQEKKVPLTRESLRQCYHKSNFYADQQVHIEMTKAAYTKSAYTNTIEHWSPFSRQIFSKTFTHSFFKHALINFKRQATLSWRNKPELIPRLGQSVFMSLVLGSVFFQLSPDDYFLRVSIMLYAIIFSSYAGIVELVAVDSQKKVVYKQTDAGMYPESTYVFSLSIVSLFLAFAAVFLFSIILYFLVGFDPDAGRFFFFCLGILLVQLFMVSLFRIVAFITPNADAAMQASAPLNFASLLFSGFLLQRDNIPEWMLFLYYLSPFSWDLQSMALNEFNADRYSSLAPSSNNSTSVLSKRDQYLINTGMRTDNAWKWAGIGYLIGMFVLITCMSVVVLKRYRQELSVGTRRIEDEESPNDSGELRRDVSRQLSKGPSKIDIPIQPSSNTIASGVPMMNSSIRNNQNSQVSASSVLPFQPLDLAWKDLEYTVQVKDDNGKLIDRKLLNSVSGYARAGSITALMGSSGAGKTTLMDVIAGRKTAGKLKGDIYINGYPKENATFNRSCGYVEQRDIHIGTQTVREALVFSAKLRLPSSVTSDQRNKFIDEVLNLLELTALADRLIGDDTLPHGLSPGQLKRVTIAVELVSNPPILFLDEPTSGLDSRAALVVMRVIKRIAMTGRSVLCTIHQPSAELFYMFDRVAVLQSGGRVAYFGDLGEFGSTLVDYFQNVPIESDQYERPVLPNNTNPASWMLDVIGSGPGAKAAGIVPPDFATIYESTSLAKQNQEGVELLTKPKQGVKVLTYDSVHARNQFIQFSEIFQRLWKSYWRDVTYNYTRFVVLVVLSILFGLLYFKIKDDTESGVFAKLSVIYAVLGFVGSSSVVSSLPVLFRMRAVFYRERASYLYTSIVYSTAVALIEIPYLIVGCIAFSLPFYWMTALEATAAAYFQFVLVLLLESICFTYLGQLLISLLPNLVVANIMQGVLVTFVFLFGGIFVPPGNIPAGWKWVFYMDWLPKGLFAVASNQFICDDDHPCPTFNKQKSVEDFLSIDFSINQYWNNIGWLFLTIFVIHLLMALAVRYVSHIVR